MATPYFTGARVIEEDEASQPFFKGARVIDPATTDTAEVPSTFTGQLKLAQESLANQTPRAQAANRLAAENQAKLAAKERDRQAYIETEAERRFQEAGGFGKSWVGQTVDRSLMGIGTTVYGTIAKAAAEAGIDGAQDIADKIYTTSDIQTRVNQKIDEAAGRGTIAKASSKGLAALANVATTAGFPGGAVPTLTASSMAENLDHAQRAGFQGMDAYTMAAPHAAIDGLSMYYAGKYLGTPVAKIAGVEGQSVVNKAVDIMAKRIPMPKLAQLGAETLGEAGVQGSVNSATAGAQYLTGSITGEHEFNGEEMRNQMTGAFPEGAAMGIFGKWQHDTVKAVEQRKTEFPSIYNGVRAAQEFAGTMDTGEEPLFKDAHHGATPEQVESAKAATTPEEFEKATGIPKATKPFIEAFQETLQSPIEETKVNPTDVPVTGEPPSTPSTPEPTTTGELPNVASTKQAILAENAQLMGLLEMGPHEEYSFQQALDSARAKGLPQKAIDLATDLDAHPRAMTPDEKAGAAIRMMELQQGYADAEKRKASVQTDTDRNLIQAEQDRIQTEFDKIRQAAHIYGGEWAGRALAFQKLVIQPDMTLLSVMSRAKQANDGKEVPTSRKVVLENETRKYNEAAQKVEQHDRADAEMTPEQREAQVDKILADLKDVKGEDKGTAEANAKAKTIEQELEAIAKSQKQRGDRKPTKRETAAARLLRLEQAVEADKTLSDDQKAKYKQLISQLGTSITASEKPPQLTMFQKVLEAIGNFHTSRTTQKPETISEIDSIARELSSLSKGATVSNQSKPEKKAGKLERIQALRERIDKVQDVAEVDKQSARDALDKLQTYYEAKNKNAYLDGLAKTKGSALTPEEIKRFGEFYDSLEAGEKRLAQKLTNNQKRDDLVYEQNRARQKVQEEINKLKPKRIFSHAMEPFHLLRALWAAFDMSGVLRQGGMLAASHPWMATKALAASLKPALSEKNAARLDADIWKRPNAPLYDRAKLFLHREDKLSSREESYMSKWAEQIPGFKVSQRAYTAFLNRLRADAFDTMASTLTKGGAPTEVEAKAIANYINVATGRGGIGLSDRAMEGMTALFFAPRYTLSRFQLALGQPLMQGTNTARTRKLIAQEYARSMVGIGTFYMLAAAAWGDRKDFNIGHDPNKGTFGKIQIGPRTYIDPLMGLSQTYRVMYSMLRGMKRTITKEKLTPEQMQQDTLSDIGRFARTKAAPLPGLAMDLASGKDVTGRKFEASDLVPSLVNKALKGEKVTEDDFSPDKFLGKVASPLVLRDVAQIFREQDDLPTKAALSALAVLGQGIQIYGLPDNVVVSRVEGDRAIEFRDMKTDEVVGGPFKERGNAVEWLKNNGYKRTPSGFHRETPVTPPPKRRK